MLNRTIPPKYQDIEDISFPWPEFYALKNQIPLYILNQGMQPIVEVELIFKSGSYYEGKPGAGYFTALMLLEGTTTKTGQEIAHIIDGYGATLSIRPQVDFCSMTLSTLSKHLTPLLDLFRELLLQPSFPEKSLMWLKSLKSQAIQMADKKKQSLAYKLFCEALFTPAHPYGKALTVQDVAAIQLEDLRHYYDTALLNDSTAFVSGQVTETDLKSIQQFLEQLPRNIVPEPAQYELSYLPKKVVDTQAQGVQSSIVVGKQSLVKNDPDFLPMFFVNEVLGGYFGSRLMCNIREEKGYTYGIHSRLVSLRKAGYWVVMTEVSPELSQHTLQEIYKEINILQQTLVPATELQKVQNYMLGHFLTTINDPFAMMQKFQSAYLYGLDETYYSDFYHHVRNMTAETIQSLAQKYLALDTFTEVVVA